MQQDGPIIVILKENLDVIQKKVGSCVENRTVHEEVMVNYSSSEERLKPLKQFVDALRDQELFGKQGKYLFLVGKVILLSLVMFLLEYMEVNALFKCYDVIKNFDNHLLGVKGMNNYEADVHLGEAFGRYAYGSGGENVSEGGVLLKRNHHYM